MNIFSGNRKWLALGIVLLLATYGVWIFLIGFYLLIYFGGFFTIAFFYGQQKSENFALLTLSTLSVPPDGLNKISCNMDSVTKIKNFDKRMTGASIIDDVLKEVLEYTVRDYIKTWYRSVSGHDAFHVNIWQCAQKVVISFAHRTKEIDWMPYFTQRLVDDFASHIRLYRRALDKRKKLSPEDRESCDIEELFFDLEVDMEESICRDLICLDPEKEREYLQNLSDVLLFLLLPKEDFLNKPFRFIMREVLVNGVFVPTIDLFSDPDYINQYIAWMCQIDSFTKESFLSVIKSTDCMDELEAVKLKVEGDMAKWRAKDGGGQDDTLVKQNLNSLRFVKETYLSRIKRLEEGPVDNELLTEESELLKCNNLYILDLDDVIDNNIALQTFIEFMTSKSSQQILFFYLNVEGFRTAAEQQISEAQKLKSSTNKTLEPDLQSLRRAAMIIYDQYLSEKATMKIKLPSDLVKTTLQNIKNRILSEDVFDIVQARSKLRKKTKKKMEDDIRSELQESNDQDSLKKENQELREENAALRTSLRIIKGLPELLDRMRSTAPHWYPPTKVNKPVLVQTQAKENTPLTQARENMPLTQARENMPLTQARENMPLTQARENMPLTQARENTPVVMPQITQASVNTSVTNSSCPPKIKLQRVFNYDVNAEGKVYQILHTQYFEEFLQSNYYVKLLAELGMLTNSISEDGDALSIDEEGCISISTPDDIIDPMEQSPDSLSLDSVSSTSSYGTQSSEAYIVAQISQTGIVKEPDKSGKSYAIFAITVRRKVLDSDEETVTDVYRRYSDFHDLHMLITEACPDIKAPHLPGKTILKNISKEFLEKRRQALDHYLRHFLKPELWQRYPLVEELILQFLAPGLWEKHKSDIARKMDTFVNPLRSSVKTMSTAVKSVPDGITDGFGKMSKVSSRDSPISPYLDRGKVGKDLNPDDEENIPVRIMLLLMDEVFDLRHKNQSLRRMIVTILRQLISATYGDTINRKIVDHVDLMTSAAQMSEYIKTFRDSFWPDGTLADPRTNRDINTKMRTRIYCKSKMLGSVPDELKTLLGADVVRLGVSRLFEMFQHRNLNKRILYVCLEGVLHTMFASNKFTELFQKLHSQSERIEKMKKAKEGSQNQRQPEGGVRKRLSTKL